jgi:hypothetical protein
MSLDCETTSPSLSPLNQRKAQRHASEDAAQAPITVYMYTQCQLTIPYIFALLKKPVKYIGLLAKHYNQSFQRYSSSTALVPDTL